MLIHYVSAQYKERCVETALDCSKRQLTVTSYSSIVIVGAVTGIPKARGETGGEVVLCPETLDVVQPDGLAKPTRSKVSVGEGLSCRVKAQISTYNLYE